MTVHAMVVVETEAGVEHTGTVHDVLEEFGAAKLGEACGGAGIRLQAEVRADALHRMETRLRDATRGAASMRQG